MAYFSFILFAFVAELIDSGIGMGYSTLLTTTLLSIGIGTAIASSVVHVSEIFTTLISGLSHLKLGNFDKKSFWFLVIPGVVGGSLGAFIAAQTQGLGFMKPTISSLLLILGLIIIIKFLKKKDLLEKTYRIPRVKNLVPLGFIAGFIDALGGGGWGPITAPTLISADSHPKNTIGSVNVAEFFVTLSISITFFISLPNINWEMIFPLVIGGVIAAPIGAWLIKKMPDKIVGITVGVIISILSLRTILTSLGTGFLF